MQHQLVAAREGFEGLEEDFDGHSDFVTSLGFDVAQVRHDAYAFVELDERDDVGVLKNGSGGYCGITKLYTVPRPDEST